MEKDYVIEKDGRAIIIVYKEALRYKLEFLLLFTSHLVVSYSFILLYSHNLAEMIIQLKHFVSYLIS